jgi:hypothetical protein
VVATGRFGCTSGRGPCGDGRGAPAIVDDRSNPGGTGWLPDTGEMSGVVAGRATGIPLQWARLVGSERRSRSVGGATAEMTRGAAGSKGGRGVGVVGIDGSGLRGSSNESNEMAAGARGSVAPWRK